MCSHDQAEVEAVKNELFRAGIVAESRPNPVADALGVPATELWVQDERDFFDASRLYAEMQDRAAGRIRTPAPRELNPAHQLFIDPPEPELETYNSPALDPDPVVLDDVPEPRREELKHASSLLERGIEQMFRRESELATECVALHSRLEQLTEELAQQKSLLAREAEARSTLERKQGEKVSALLTTQERERHEWRQQLKSRDELIKQAQEKTESASRLLQAEQSAAVALREEMVALRLKEGESDKALTQAREETAAEREARQAADQRAEKAIQDLRDLQQQLSQYKHLEEQIQAHVSGLSSLFGKRPH